MFGTFFLRTVVNVGFFAAPQRASVQWQLIFSLGSTYTHIYPLVPYRCFQRPQHNSNAIASPDCTTKRNYSYASGQSVELAMRWAAPMDFSSPSWLVFLARPEKQYSLEPRHPRNSTKTYFSSRGAPLVCAKLCSPGGAITFKADADNNQVGSFAMDQTQSITAAGRNITISGASVTAGTIATFTNDGAGNPGGNINLTATNGNVNAVSLRADSEPPTGSSGNGGNITVNASGVINITGTLKPTPRHRGTLRLLQVMAGT
jgi:hypothetical protein